MALDNRGARRPHSRRDQETGSSSTNVRPENGWNTHLDPEEEKRMGITGSSRSSGFGAGGVSTAGASAGMDHDTDSRLSGYSRSIYSKDGFGGPGPENKDPRVHRINSRVDSGELDLERKRAAQKKKSRRNRIILMAFVEVLTLVIIFSVGVVARYMNMSQKIDFDVSKVKNQNIDVTRKKTMEGYWTAVVFGVDSRNGDVGKGTNADVQIIVNVDLGNGDVKMVSVYRDTYLNLGKGSRYAKINEAYADGGPEQAVAALNKNLDLDIEHYITFNWKAVADTISMIGGVDVDITKKEFYYMNAYIHETCIKSGINPKNPAAEYIKGPGMQHLDGVQAVAYARLRYMDNDFERTRRQREIIEQVLEKAKKTDLGTLTSIMDTVLPQVSFNIDTGDILDLVKGISHYTITGSQGFPEDLKDQMMGKKGDCVIPTTLSTNVVKLHQFLFNDTDFKPSSAVETYSRKITDDALTYKSGGSESSGKESSGSKNSKISTETDDDGYLISGYDSKGRAIYETNSNGEKIPATTKSSTKTTYGTDEEGNLVDSDGRKLETNSEGKYIESSGNTGTKQETTVREPGSESKAEESTKSGESSPKSSESISSESPAETSASAAESTKPASSAANPGESRTSPETTASTTSVEAVVPGGDSHVETAAGPGA